MTILPTRLQTFIVLVAALALHGCGGDDSAPSSPTSTGAISGSNLSTLGSGSGAMSTAASPTMPTIESPQPGEHVQSLQPLLTVINATGGSARTYTFEVASTRAFTEIEASESMVLEGEEGTTSWMVTTVLEAGKQHYWRSRVTIDGQPSAYTEIVNFYIKDGFTSDRLTGGLVVFDPLTGSSVATEVSGGRFTDKGWQSQSNADYIRYQIPTLPEGFIEFDVTNIAEPNPAAGKRMLLSMWDPTKGDYRENPFRVHLQKMDANTVKRWDVRLRWISRGQETNEGISFFDFEADVVYPWRIEWGSFRGIKSQQVRVFLEGVQILTRNYDKLYHPKVHWVELGNQERAETLEQAIWSNVRIGSR